MAKNYSTLLSEIQVGKRLLRNRIIKTAAGSRYWSQDGFVTDRVKALFDKISAGGAAMVVVDTLSFMPWDDVKFTMGGVWNDKFIDGLKELTDLVHSNGALVVGQLHHPGPSDVNNPVGPSELTEEEMPLNDPCPRALSIDEIENMKQHYFAAVERLVKAGFDGVEVHAAHGYFMASFLSRVWNKRVDEYGIGSFENRTRLPREIMQGVKEIAPKDFLMGVRFNGIEFGNERGMTIKESCEIAKIFESEGADYLSVTGEGYGKIESPMLYLPVDYFPYPEPDNFMKPYIKDFEYQGTLIPAAAAITRCVHVPVVCVGRLDENIAEDVLREGKADIAGFNRALWCDPDMPRKLLEGRPEDIRHCTRCGTCEGGGSISAMGPRVCRMNPALGRYDREIRPAEKKKKVMVIGGGPAGMEAAATAANCGHDVTLYEKESKLGGHLPLASMIKGTYLDNVETALQYLVRAVNTSAVKVRTGVSVDIDFIRNEMPDAVIVACGGKYEIEPISGESIFSHTNVNRLQAQAKLPLKLLGASFVDSVTKCFLPGIGKNVVVVGSGVAGVQGALWLKKRSRNVAIVSKDDRVADQVPPRYRNRLLPWFSKHSTTIYTGVENTQIENKKMIFEIEGKEQELDCDTAVTLPSMSSNLNLYEEICSEGIEAYVVGSAKGNGNEMIVDAIRDGREAGLLL